MRPCAVVPLTCLLARVLGPAWRALAFLFIVGAAFAAPVAVDSHAWFVAPGGDDGQAGSAERPFATLERAVSAARERPPGQAAKIYVRAGTYYLSKTIELTARDSGTEGAPFSIEAYPGENPVISGGRRLELAWEPHAGGILKAKVPAGLTADQLFVNGARQRMARYPNYDPAIIPFGGFAADSLSAERAKRWADPAGGFIHAWQSRGWGSMQFRITGKDAAGNLVYEGGWQNNRKLGMHETRRYVENIFEELDAPGEWYLDHKTDTLYFYPPAKLDLAKARIEVTGLRTLFSLRGAEKSPVKWIALRGLTLRHTERTFMDNREPLTRSDWTIYRGGAVFIEGAENVTIEDCTISEIGGTAVFASNYNRHVTVRGCHIFDAGDNGVVFIGDPQALRSPLFNYTEKQKLADIDRTPGPRSNNYPAECLVDDCLIYRTGRFEKQSAAVQIQIAEDITVRHCSIYDVPRAGINIGDGAWGGHIIEFCDVFDTVKETSDNGSFNSWGRDRYWRLEGADPNKMTQGELKALDLPRLDSIKPTILRNSRWRCDHGIDIDLDDGSSNYEIYNNLCLSTGLKNREGFYRVVENNILVNSSFRPGLWFEGSEDVFRHNIVLLPYQPILTPRPWGKEVDYNLLHAEGEMTPRPAKVLQEASGRDVHSIVADALFVDAAHGDFRVRPESPALALGFKNFPMDQFGVQKPSLKAIARTPKMTVLVTNREAVAKALAVQTWFGAKIRNIDGVGEMSAFGTPGENGVIITEVAADSPAAAAGLKVNDVIIGLDTNGAYSVSDLRRSTAYHLRGTTDTLKTQLKVLRTQEQIQLTITLIKNEKFAADGSAK